MGLSSGNVYRRLNPLDEVPREGLPLPNPDEEGEE